MSLFVRNILIALGITLVIAGTVIYAVNYLNNARVAELKPSRTSSRLILARYAVLAARGGTLRQRGLVNISHERALRPG